MYIHFRVLVANLRGAHWCACMLHMRLHTHTFIYLNTQWVRVEQPLWRWLVPMYVTCVYAYTTHLNMYIHKKILSKSRCGTHLHVCMLHRCAYTHTHSYMYMHVVSLWKAIMALIGVNIYYTCVRTHTQWYIYIDIEHLLKKRRSAHLCASILHMYTHTHTFICLHTYWVPIEKQIWRSLVTKHVHTHTHSHMYLHIEHQSKPHHDAQLSLHMCTHTHTFIYLHMCTHTHIHIFTHAYTHTHLHIFTQLLSTCRRATVALICIWYVCYQCVHTLTHTFICIYI